MDETTQTFFSMRISNFAVAAALLAVTLPGAKAETPFDGPVFTPDPSKPVASVSKVQVNFPNGNYLTEFNTGSKDEVIISKGTQSKKCTDVSGFGSYWTFTFDKVTEPGAWTLLIPSGAFTHDGQQSPLITTVYNVSDDIDYKWTAYPPAGTEKDIPQYGDFDINFTFTDATKVELNTAVAGAKIEVKLNDNTLTAVSNTSEEEGYRLSASGTGLRLQVSKSLAPDGGTVTFHADKGAFSIDGIDSPAMDYSVTYKKPKTYTYSLTPASGSTVAGLKEVVVTFDNADTAEKAMFLNPSRVILTNEGGTETAAVSIDAVDGAAHPSFKAVFPDGLADGKYEFYIGANCFELDGKDFVSPEINGTYILDSAYVPSTGKNVPWLETFDTADSLNEFTIIDGDGDSENGTPYGKWHWAQSEYLKNESGYTEEARVMTGTDTDDWLISPALRLEAGKTYRVSLHARPYGFWSETFEVKAGTAAEPDKMTMTVIPETLLKDGSTGEGDFYGYLTPDTGGDWNIGVHATTKADGFYLHVDNLSVSAPIESNVPAAVDDFKVDCNYNDPLVAVITMNAPSKDSAGNAIDAIEKIEIKRNGTVINTIANPAPGAKIEYKDEVTIAADYTYSALAYNNAGAGMETSLTAFIGVPKASFPTEVKGWETENEGEVKLTWKAPETDENGKPINPDNIDYMINELYFDGEGIAQKTVAQGVKGTSYVFQAVAEGEPQQFKCYGIFAHTTGGYSNGSQTRDIALGKAYTLPWTEGFGGESPMLAVYTMAGKGFWGIYSEADGNITAPDGDQAFAGMSAETAGDAAIMVTGKIDLRTAVEPVLGFQVYHPAGNSIGTIDVQVESGDDFKSVKTFTVDGAETAGWKLSEVDLSAFKGKKIQLGFYATGTQPNTLIRIDDLNVEDKSSGIAAVESNDVRFTTAPGAIVVAGAGESVANVYSMDGRLVTSSIGDGRIDVAAGIYLVKCGNSTAKLAVK